MLSRVVWTNRAIPYFIGAGERWDRESEKSEVIM